MAFCLLLKIPQSPEERKPLFDAVAVAMVNVQVPVEEVIESPDKPDVAKEIGEERRTVPVALLTEMLLPA